MKQYEYFAADYRTGKKQLKRDFAHDMVALFENENATLNDMREGRKALKAKYKADKRTLKKESKRLEKAFRKDFGMLRRPIMADIFDFFEEDRAVPNGRTPFNDEIKIEKDIVYKTVDGKNLVMDIYYPSRPVVLRYRNDSGYKVMESLSSHHAILIQGDVIYKLLQMAKVYGSDTEVI